VNHPDARAQTPGVVGLTLFAGDRLAVASGARADVQLDNRVLRLAAHTELRLVREESGSYQMALDKGSPTCHVVEAPATTFDLSTPSVSLKPEAPGVHRIAVTGARESQISVHQGHIQVFSPQGSEWVLPGQKMVARGPADNPEFKIVSAFRNWPRVLAAATISVSLAASIAAGNARSRHGR